MTNANMLSLSDARATARRAIEKAYDLGQRATYVIMDRNGYIVTVSRMDGARMLSYRISRAKAHATAIYGASTGDLYDFNMSGPSILMEQIMSFAREPIFQGAGSQVIRNKDGALLGAITTGMGVAPFVQLPGVDPEKLTWEGQPANAEDLVMSYALRRPYTPQHGDDAANWIAAYGKLPETRGTGTDEAPPVTDLHELDNAIRLSDAAMAEARRRNVLISVVVVDEGGEVVQIDRMDGAAPMTPDISTALAVTAVNFEGSSANAAGYDLAAMSNASNLKFLGMPGGLSLVRDGLTYGGIGISGTDPKICEEIAKAAVAIG